MKDIVIIGSGLFGSITAKALRHDGWGVTIIDSHDPMAASKCSACLFKPSWLESLSKEQVSWGWSVLENLYNVRTVEFLAQASVLSKHVSINWIDPAEILLAPDIEGTVTEVNADGTVRYTSKAGQDIKVKPRAVLVAAGVRCSTLVPMPPMRALVGASLRASAQLKEAMLRIYAPYKQAVAFNISPTEVWIGDGVAIMDKNWDERKRISDLAMRACNYFGLRYEFRYFVGARPYVEGYKQGYFAKVYPNVWVSTGGAKNGTLLAAYQARQFLEAL